MHSLAYSTVSESLGGSVCFQACVVSIKRLWSESGDLDKMSALLAGLRVVFGRRPGPHVSFHWICCVVYVVTIL